MSSQDPRPDRDPTLFSICGVDLPFVEASGPFVHTPLTPLPEISFREPRIDDPRDWRNVVARVLPAGRPERQYDHCIVEGAPVLSHDAQAREVIGQLDQTVPAPYTIGAAVPLGAKAGNLYVAPSPNGLPDLSDIDFAVARPALPGDPLQRFHGARRTPALPPIPPGRINVDPKPVPDKIVISVYLDDGRIFEYDVNTASQAREHTAAIVTGGYRHCSNGTEKTPTTDPFKQSLLNTGEIAVDGVLEHYPPHRILKVKASGPGIRTNYPDRVRGT